MEPYHAHVGNMSVPYRSETVPQPFCSALFCLALFCRLTVQTNPSIRFIFDLQNITKEWTFLLFTFLLLFFWIFTFLFLPETKNKKVEDIQAIFQDKRRLFAFRADPISETRDTKSEDC